MKENGTLDMQLKKSGLSHFLRLPDERFRMP